MGSGFQFVDIIFFALVAVFIILRLRSVLGRRTGHEQRNANPFPPQSRSRTADADARHADADAGADNVVRLPGQAGQQAETAAPETPLGAGLTQIKLADSDFDPADFLEKAKAAFEYIVMAFAEGDTGKLKPLLANDVYEEFAGAIKARKEKNETLETNVIRIKDVEITDASMEGRIASVTVRYISEQVNITRDADGKVVDGDSEHITEAVDLWTFERNTRSADPNWALVATETPE